MAEWLYQYRPLKSRTRNTKIAIILSLLFASVTVGCDVLGTLLVPNWNDLNQPYSGHPLEGPLITIMIMGGLTTFVCHVFSVVFACMWMYRANINTQALGTEGISVKPGWAVGWWFIPFANLLMPYRAMKEIYLGSEQDRWSGHVKTSPNPGLLTGWWSLWLISIVVSRITRRLSDDANVEIVEAMVWLSIFEWVLTVCAAYLFFKIIDRVTYWQEVRAVTHQDPIKRQCPDCGYDLRASPGLVCPECGFDARHLDNVSI